MLILLLLAHRDLASMSAMLPKADKRPARLHRFANVCAGARKQDCTKCNATLLVGNGALIGLRPPVCSTIAKYLPSKCFYKDLEDTPAIVC